MIENNIIYENQLIDELAAKFLANDSIDPELYTKYDVKRGLRDSKGKGVLAGLTKVSQIISNKDGEPCEGELYYRGYNINDLVDGFISENRFGFEEIVYLLLFGELPSKEDLIKFNTLLAEYRFLPPSFVRDIIMKATSKDTMNILARGVLTLYSYDDNPDDTSISNVLNQCIGLISRLPLMAVYSYNALDHYHNDASLFVHKPLPEKSTAENILHLLRNDSSYTALEAKILDLALVLHAEHGGGNNSTFTTHVVTSSGTDTYSSVAASLCSLKGPKHGGANIKVVNMISEIKENVKDWNDDEEIQAYLIKILNKEAFDKSGLIYGMGHAVYSLSDPRSELFKIFVKELAKEKNRLDELALYSKVEKIAPKAIAEKRKIFKGVSANIDFYSGFVYSMLDLPIELYTPLFSIARIAGWSAHRLEELYNGGKIVRPAYKTIFEKYDYIALSDR